MIINPLWIANAFEARDAMLAAGHRLAVDDAGARAKLGERLDDERETIYQVVARPAVEPSSTISPAAPLNGALIARMS